MLISASKPCVSAWLSLFSSTKTFNLCLYCCENGMSDPKDMVELVENSIREYELGEILIAIGKTELVQGIL